MPAQCRTVVAINTSAGDLMVGVCVHDGVLEGESGEP